MAISPSLYPLIDVPGFYLLLRENQKIITEKRFQ